MIRTNSPPPLVGDAPATDRFGPSFGDEAGGDGDEKKEDLLLSFGEALGDAVSHPLPSVRWRVGVKWSENRRLGSNLDARVTPRQANSPLAVGDGRALGEATRPPRSLAPKLRIADKNPSGTLLPRLRRSRNEWLSLETRREKEKRSGCSMKALWGGGGGW